MVDPGANGMRATTPLTSVASLTSTNDQKELSNRNKKSVKKRIFKSKGRAVYPRNNRSATATTQVLQNYIYIDDSDDDDDDSSVEVLGTSFPTAAMTCKSLPRPPHHSRAPILEFLSDDIMAEIYLYLGPTSTTLCSFVCQQWQNVSYNSRSLWKQYCHTTFGLSEGPLTADWRAIYSYVSNRYEEEQPVVIPVKVKFADDGSSCPGYPAEHAVSPVRGAWCTNAGVDHDVDLLVQCDVPSLVIGFVARNGGLNFSAPLKRALVFASYLPIDLDETRRYNGQVGLEYVSQLEGNEVEHIPRAQTMQRWMQEIAESQILDITGSFTTSSHHDHLQHDGNIVPSKTAARRMEPIVGFRIPELPRAYHARMERHCPPMVARYIQFKLLCSYNSPERLSDNIDVMDLLTFGIPLPKLSAMLQETQEGSAATAVPPDPSYRRMHPIREYPYMNLL